MDSWLIFSVSRVLCGGGVFSFGAEGRSIRVILRLRQPARSKEQGNSFAGGQGADLHRSLQRDEKGLRRVRLPG